jgi:hypothetical protein
MPSVLAAALDGLGLADTEQNMALTMFTDMKPEIVQEAQITRPVG